MKRIILIMTLAAAAFAAAALPSSAQASGTARWCAVITIGIGGSYWDCQYASFEQCAPNVVSGNRGWCNLNPAYEGPAAKPRKVARHQRSQQY